MARFLLRFSALHKRKYMVFFLAFIWCLGLIFGIVIFPHAGESIVSLMRMAAGRPVSIVNLLIVCMLPFLFSAAAVYLHSRLLLMTVCFLKALLFGLVSVGCFASFGSAGWLIWLMVMFSDICCLIPLWWYWIYHCSWEKGLQVRSFVGCFAAVLGIISLDYSFISPFLVKLIEI